MFENLFKNMEKRNQTVTIKEMYELYFMLGVVFTIAVMIHPMLGAGFCLCVLKWNKERIVISRKLKLKNLREMDR